MRGVSFKRWLGRHLTNTETNVHLVAVHKHLTEAKPQPPQHHSDQDENPPVARDEVSH